QYFRLSGASPQGQQVDHLLDRIRSRRVLHDLRYRRVREYGSREYLRDPERLGPAYHRHPDHLYDLLRQRGGHRPSGREYPPRIHRVLGTSGNTKQPGPFAGPGCFWYSRRMKKDIHPADYRLVIFEDMASGRQFLIGSTIKTKETGTFEGKE